MVAIRPSDVLLNVAAPLIFYPLAYLLKISIGLKRALGCIDNTLFSLYHINGPHKLECLSLGGFSSLV
jgi:hypothetical protein